MTAFERHPSKYYIEPKHHDEITAKMLAEPFEDPAEPGMVWPGLSFASQMQLAVDKDRLGHVFVTANSAIPVADAVRGYCEELGIEVPPIDYIRSNRELSQYPLKDAHIYRPQIDAEVARLTDIAEGTHGDNIPDTVLVIDQYVYGGGTLDLAVKMLRGAGFADPVKMRGQWWGSVEVEEVDFNKVTSVHADFMRDIGAAAAGIHFDNLDDY